ncbi:MAG: hypothetical protein PHG25_04370 [Candidatus Pacebacteria bacterium]|nr:hypothetical protein [Candidatus Paceibacterota bacterium]
MKILLLCISLICFGCTHVKWVGQDGTTLSVTSFLADKKFKGTLKDGQREVVMEEFEEDQTSGAAKITGAAVEAAIKGMKP